MSVEHMTSMVRKNSFSGMVPGWAIYDFVLDQGPHLVTPFVKLRLYIIGCSI